MRSVLQPPRALLLVCAYLVHFYLLLSEASHCSLPLQPRCSLDTLQPLLIKATSRSSCYSPSTKWHDALTARDSSPLLWLRATMDSVLSYSAHSTELSLFCLLFQLHFVVVYIAVFTVSSSGTSDTTVWSSVRGRCSRFTVKVFYNNAFCCLSLVWKVRCRCGPSVVSNTTPTPLCDSLGCVHPHNEGLHRGLLSRRGPLVHPAPLTCHRFSLFFVVSLFTGLVTFTRYFPSRVLLTVSLLSRARGRHHVFEFCHGYVGAFLKATLRRRLLLNAKTDFCWKSHLPGSSRAPSTSEPPACRFPGPCASAFKRFSAETHQHLLDLPVASTAPSESSAPVLSFHCSPFKMFWSLLSRRSPCQSTDSCTLRSKLMQRVGRLSRASFFLVPKILVLLSERVCQGTCWCFHCSSNLWIFSFFLRFFSVSVLFLFSVC